MTRIVLSHSHNDHTGGLGGLAPNVPIRTIVGGLHLCHATIELNLAVLKITHEVARTKKPEGGVCG